jgi:hypothetical protein
VNKLSDYLIIGACIASVLALGIYAYKSGPSSLGGIVSKELTSIRMKGRVS